MRQAAFTVRRIGLAVTYAPAIGKRRSGRRKPKDILIIIDFVDECPNRVNVCADGSAENETAHSDRRRLPRGDGEVMLTPTWIALKGNRSSRNPGGAQSGLSRLTSPARRASQTRLASLGTLSFDLIW